MEVINSLAPSVSYPLARRVANRGTKCPMKKCSKCGAIREESEFYKDPRTSSGLYSECKKCNREAKILARNLVRGHPPIHKTKEEKSLRMNNYMRWYRKKEPHKVAARAYARNTLVKQPCIECGHEKSEAHHHKGYERENWLEVQWLCKKHHEQTHHDQQR